MSKKLNAVGGFRLGQQFQEFLDALPPSIADEAEGRMKDKRLIREAAKVATYNRLMVPVAKPGSVTEAQAETASGKGQGDA